METCGEAGLARVSADWLLMPCGLGRPFLLWASLPSAARVGEGFPTSWGVRSGLSLRPRTKHLLHPTPALLAPRHPAQQASHVCEEPSPQHRDIGLSPTELGGQRGTSGWIPVPAQPGRGLAPGGEATSPGHSARCAAGRAASLAGGRPWAGPPAPRVAVQVGTMTLSRHASFSHSNFGAAGQRGHFIIVGLDQQPARPEPHRPCPAQAPGPGRPTAQLGQSPATLSPLAQPHPSRDPLAFLAFCPFGLSWS